MSGKGLSTDGRRAGVLLLLLVGLVALSGASCPAFAPPLLVSQPARPPVLSPGATLQRVIEVVNGNSSQIQRFSANRATLSGPGFPTLWASVVFERPRRFRLRAETSLFGSELDLGSNDELFWIWVRRNQPRALYYCRHDQFAGSRAQRMLPIDPRWLIEAFGVAELDPALPHQGPTPAAGGRLVVRTVRETLDGPTTKVTVIEQARGLVLEQHVYDHRGQLVASAVASCHRQDPLSGLTMPKVVDIYCPKAEFSMRVDLGNVEINRPLGNPAGLWTMPAYQDSPAVNLCDPNTQWPPGAPPGVMTSRASPVRSGWRAASR